MIPPKSKPSEPSETDRYQYNFFSRADYFADTQMPLYVDSWRAVQPVAAHAHDFTELVLVLSGTAEHVTTAARYPLCPGDVFVIVQGEEHAYESVDGLVAMNICFDEELLGLTAADISRLPGYHTLFALEPRMRDRHEFRSRLQLTASELEFITPVLQRLERELKQRAAGYQTMAQGLFYQFITFVCRCYSAASQPESYRLNRIAEALSHIEHHYAEAITIADLCRAASMSERSLLRAFRECFELSPIAYLVRHRVHRGAELLSRTEMTIGEVALAVGFADCSYFARQFRQWMHLSPRAYRRRFLADEGQAPAMDQGLRMRL